MSEAENRIARKLVSIAERGGPQFTQSGDRLIIETAGQTITIELNQTVQQSSSSPRYR